MNKEQLFDALGEVDDRYVQQAQQKPARRPGRRVWIAAAACLVLLLAAWPVYRLIRPAPALHAYTLVEMNLTATDDSGTLDSLGEPLDGGGAGPDSEASGGWEDLSQIDWSAANAVYQRLTSLLRANPEWLGGVYFDHHYSDHVARLVILVVEEYDTKEFELELLDKAGGEVIFGSAKYSRAYLLDLQEQVCDQLYDLGVDYGCGLDEETNRLDLMLSAADEQALALLAQLDPDGDAIRVQVGHFTAVDDIGGPDIDASDLDGDPSGYAP